MLGIIDKPLKKFLLKKLHKKRQKIIDKTVKDFAQKYHPEASVLNELKRLLENEADRIYPIVDDSILESGIKRARYIFWVTAITSSILAAFLVAITHGIALSIIIPIVTALISWGVSLGTIPISYDQRVQGSMDSTVITFLKKLDDANKEASQSIEDKIGALKVKLKSITEELQQLEQQFLLSKEKELALEKTNEKRTTNETANETQTNELNEMIMKTVTSLLRDKKINNGSATISADKHFHFFSKLKNYLHDHLPTHHHHKKKMSMGK